MEKGVEEGTWGNLLGESPQEVVGEVALEGALNGGLAKRNLWKPRDKPQSRASSERRSSLTSS